MARSEVARTLSQCRGFNLGFAPPASSASKLSEDTKLSSATGSAVFLVPFSKDPIGIDADDCVLADTWADIAETFVTVSESPTSCCLNIGGRDGGGGGGGGTGALDTRAKFGGGGGGEENFGLL